MLKIKKVTGTAKGIPAGLALGLLISIAVTVAGAAVAAWLMASEKIGEGAVGYAAMVILAVAAALGAWSAATMTKRLRLQVCMLSGGCYYLTLLAMTALLFGGQYQGMGAGAIVILAGCALIAFLPAKNGGGWKKRKKAYR